MRKFDGKCPACGSWDVTRKYISQHDHSHLSCACTCCGYAWPALPLFTEEPEPASEPQPATMTAVVRPIRLLDHYPWATIGEATTPQQPEPPLTPYHAPKLPMEVGSTIEFGSWRLRRTSGGQYRLGHLEHGTVVYSPWSDWIALARWIIEQEEARTN